MGSAHAQLLAVFAALLTLQPLPSHASPKKYLLETKHHNRAHGGKKVKSHQSGDGGNGIFSFVRPGAANGGGGADYMIGGRAVGEEIYPWAVRVYLSKDHKCGGSLITDRTVLTAAHCVDEDKVLFRYRVAAGSPLLPLHLEHYNDTLLKAKLYKVQKILLHPGYKITDDRKSAVNDVALMILEDSVPLGKQGPICLPKTSQPLTEEGTIIGWGQINSLIDFINQYAKMDIDRVDLRNVSKPEEIMYKALVQLIPGAESLFVKNLKIKKEVSAVEANITRNYEELFRKKGVEAEKIDSFKKEVLPELFGTFKKLLENDNFPETNQRALLAEQNPFIQGPRSGVLKETQMKFETAKECATTVQKANENFKGDLVYEKSFLCVNPTGGKDQGHACLGDGGSPIFIKAKEGHAGGVGKYVVAGVFSFFFEDITQKWPPTCFCFCETSKHSVYANVAEALPWIQENMAKDKLGQEGC